MSCPDYVENDTGTVHGPVRMVDKAGAVIDATGGTARLKYKINGLALQTKTMTINSPSTDGKVQYQFLAGELIKGVMIGEVEFTDSSGAIITELCQFRRVIRAKT